MKLKVVIESKGRVLLEMPQEMLIDLIADQMGKRDTVKRVIEKILLDFKKRTNGI